MNISVKGIDSGNAFDFGRTSSDYAKFRDIYPPEFYEKIAGRGLCVKGQSVLDIGTGTGVLPRNMYRYGAKWTGEDISENQIGEAKKLSQGMNIDYCAAPVEKLGFSDNSFDVITACQCIWYFDHERIMPELYRMLKADGRILILYMAWLPYEDKIAEASENLVLKYNPDWTGAGETMHTVFVPDCFYEKFELVHRDEYKINVHFTRESWNGRMKACRGVGASLPEEKIKAWEREHLKLLSETAPEEFDILHYAATAELKKRVG